MNRREVIAGLGGAAAWPLAARAQQRALPVVGFLHPSTHPSTFTEMRSAFIAAFHQGLAETGYVEGRNVAVEYRWAEDQHDRLPALAADLVRRQVAVIASIGGAPAARAAQAATQTIPIVFLLGGDPVAMGLVASLARPGGNLTGFTILATELVAKRFELVHELVPTAAIIAFLVHSTTTEAGISAAQDATRMLGVQLLVLNATSPSEIERAFATLVRERAGALVIGGDAFFGTQRDQIIALAAQHALPTIYQFREFPASGGLVSYGGGNASDDYRQVGVYTGRILKGEKPADLPVQQATKVELVTLLSGSLRVILQVRPAI